MHPSRHPDKVAALIHRWFEEGWNNWSIIHKAQAVDVKLSHGAIGRHRRNHLEVIDPDLGPEPEESEAETQKLSDIEILDRVIRQGAKRLSGKNVQVSPEMTMRAMELKYKLTQGSVMEDTFNAIARAMGGGVENPRAAQSSDETDQGLSDSAPEARDDDFVG